jgi:hypothetical protein
MHVPDQHHSTDNQLREQGHPFSHLATRIDLADVFSILLLQSLAIAFFQIQGTHFLLVTAQASLDTGPKAAGSQT